MSIDIHFSNIKKKVKLIECLMTDHCYVLQLVHQKSIVSLRQYQNLKSSSSPQETITGLLDLVLGKGPKKCGDFLQLLKDPEVLDTFPWYHCCIAARRSWVRFPARVFLHGVCMFSLCMRGFSLGTPASSHCLKT
uniref:CARD domain-containing protein n=1 Tax=Xiphophorus maculatus TaxID=8083 RepID=A0A3B5R2D2_XIPMA